MAGCSGVHHWRCDDIVSSECALCPSILRLSTALNWLKAREPLHTNIDTAKTCGIAPRDGLPTRRLSRDWSPQALASDSCLVPSAA
ncbi:hypothetical protein GUJ93_ZPchr0015g6723 [Zizania palustris]|uniref:Sialate O-acetylesterase domain-containing protein n=1 Tax=Zizania palustris TaxID=103762 RepID=A0A8J5VVH1_ZIZPA|nr:hypothetical protein GUJ93_ZPchr0015g6723 [Zizania palustris]